MMRKLAQECDLRIRTWSFRLFKKVPMPYNAVIETGAICNLSCPLCPTGSRHHKDEQFLTAAQFTKMLRNLGVAIKVITLYNWGEPLLNPEIMQIIKIAKKQKKIVSMDTNLSLHKERSFFTDLLKTEIDTIRISLDGLSEETYTSYRKGGDIRTVIKNIQLLAHEKKLLQAKTQIIIKFLVNKHNEHEIKELMAFSQKLGIPYLLDYFGLGDDIIGWQPQEELALRKKNWLPRQTRYIHPRYRFHSDPRKPYRRHACSMLFTDVYIGTDGSMLPCCFYYKGKPTGNILERPITKIWNNGAYRQMRREHLANTEHPKTTCATCNRFR